MTSVSVLVVSYNVRDLLDRCLRSVAASAEAGLEIEAVVVDNASQDGSADLVAEGFPGAILARSDTNDGFSVAVNRAAGLAGGDLLLILNPDAELPAGTLARMTAIMDERPEVAALGVRQVNESGFFQLAVGPEPTLPRELGRKLVQDRLDGGSHRVALWADRYLSRPRAVAWAAASCLMVRREAFAEVRGFDEGFFLYYEDIDFCIRLRRAGGQILYDPSITVVHRRGASAAGAVGPAEEAYRRSQVRFWEKHRGAWSQRVLKAYLWLRGRLPGTA